MLMRGPGQFRSSHLVRSSATESVCTTTLRNANSKRKAEVKGCVKMVVSREALDGLDGLMTGLAGNDDGMQVRSRGSHGRWIG
jgi:hypothetical protein